MRRRSSEIFRLFSDSRTRRRRRRLGKYANFLSPSCPHPLSSSSSSTLRTWGRRDEKIAHARPAVRPATQSTAKRLPGEGINIGLLQIQLASSVPESRRVVECPKNAYLPCVFVGSLYQRGEPSSTSSPSPYKGIHPVSQAVSQWREF